MGTNQTLTDRLSWQSFTTMLSRFPDHELQFAYGANERVAPNYHITEIKQVVIQSVDCGGQRNAWTEIVLQLWEPGGAATGRAMPVRKALSIVELVQQQLPLDPAAPVKIEFGNSRFDTRQLYPVDWLLTSDQLTVRLTPDQTQCKAQNRPGPDGTLAACCGPLDAIEPVAVDACVPGSGCCGA
ncbi:hypothetical protein GCM10027578_36090 [Spirosoma luteolum]